ncbi:MAG TPA: hypothetical protein VM261_33885 [Kofleriaceae bacterium]|nr:hypothetical protein [Kofleriaceae bacterium]
MQPRVIVGVLALIIAAIVLFFFLQGDDEKKTEAGDGASAGNGAEIRETGSSGNAGAPRPRVRDGSGTGTGTGTGTGDGEVRTYVTDTGQIVRDHRDTKGREPNAVPAPLPPEQRTMNSVITAEMYRALAPTVRQCSNDIDASALGPSPIVNVTLSVDVSGEKLRTTDATAVVTDISGPAADRVIACVRDRAAGLTVDAKGEPDRENYVLQYPIRVR